MRQLARSSAIVSLIALLGVVACDMSGQDPESIEGELEGEAAGGGFSGEALEDAFGDPELAAEIAREKLSALRPGVISPNHHAPCGTVPPDDDPRQTADAASPNAANQRTGSSTSCAIRGVLQPSDDANYFCFTGANDGFTWTYLRNIRTGVAGWVRDDLLRDAGSFVHCDF